jgi:serine/threonine-protein kinase Chk1
MDVDSPLRYPLIGGYRIGEEIGGGGFSKWVEYVRLSTSPTSHCTCTPADHPLRVFRAIDDTQSRVAACKVVNLFISPSLGYGTPNVKELQKEVQVHKSLKHNYILEFLHSEVIDREKEGEGWVPGLYMLLELAVGGDLFDKIGEAEASSHPGSTLEC